MAIVVVRRDGRAVSHRLGAHTDAGAPLVVVEHLLVALRAHRRVGRGRRQQQQQRQDLHDDSNSSFCGRRVRTKFLFPAGDGCLDPGRGVTVLVGVASRVRRGAYPIGTGG